jgi:hypothetical protein
MKANQKFVITVVIIFACVVSTIVSGIQESLVINSTMPAMRELSASIKHPASSRLVEVEETRKSGLFSVSRKYETTSNRELVISFYATNLFSLGFERKDTALSDEYDFCSEKYRVTIVFNPTHYYVDIYPKNQEDLNHRQRC